MYKYIFTCDCYDDNEEFCEFHMYDTYFSLSNKYPIPERCPYRDNESDGKLIKVEKI